MDSFTYAYLLNNRKQIIIQFLSPYLLITTNVAGFLAHVITVFSEMDSASPSPQLNCSVFGLHTLLVTYLSCGILLLYARIGARATLRPTRMAQYVKRLGLFITGYKDLQYDWSFEKSIKKSRQSTVYRRILLFSAVASINLLIYFILSASWPNFYTPGTTNCPILYTFPTYLVLLCTIIYALLLHHVIDASLDFIQLRKGCLYTITMFVLSSLMISIGFNARIPSLPLQMQYNLLTILMGFFSFLYLLLPVLLQQKSSYHGINIHQAWKDPSMQPSLSKILNANLCSNVVMFLNELPLLDTSKPLLLQQFSKKYLDESSPLYLHIVFSPNDHWINKSNPDDFDLHLIEQKCFQVLQYSIVQFIQQAHLKSLSLSLSP